MKHRKDIQGINHLTLSVSDLDRSLKFYVDILGLKPVVRWYKGAYLLAGELWFALNVHEQVRSAPLPENSHVAFSVTEENFAEVSEKIKAAGAKIWQENRSPGASLYFLDPDGHKLEIHSSNLASRLQALKENPPRDLHFYTN